MNDFLKKITLLFCLSVISLVSHAQKSEIFIQHEFVNASLQEVLEWVEDHHPVKIAYSPQALAGIRINDDFKEISLKDFLRAILKDTPLGFRLIREDRILIGPVEELSSLDSSGGVSMIIRGRVLAPNGQALAFANLFHESSQTGTYTDEQGYFEWPETISSDTIQIEVSYLGFEKKKLTIADPSKPIQIELQPSPQFFQEIEVVEMLPAPKLSTSLSWSDHHSDSFVPVSFLPGGQNVLIDRVPGIIIQRENQASQFNIRGGNADENLIILDGMPLYNVDHFYGFFSALHPGIVQDIQVHKNLFPIEYNGRSTSIIELNSGLQEKKAAQKTSLGVDLISANALVDVSLSKNMFFRTAGRLTHQDIANTPFFQLANSDPPESNINLPEENKRATVIDLSPAFRFNDWYANWHWAIDEDHLLSASLFTSYDQYKYDYSESYFLPQLSGRLRIVEEGAERMDWQNTAYGLQFKKRWTGRFHSHVSANVSSYQTDRAESFTITQRFLNNERVRAAPRSSKLNNIEGIRFTQKNDWTLSDQFQLHFGYTFLNETIDFSINNSNGLESRGIDRMNEATTNSLFLQQLWQPVDVLEIQMGLNTQHYNLLDRWFWSPRVQAKVLASDQIQFKGAWSIYQQFLRQLFHEDVFGKNQAIWLLAGTSQIFPNRLMPHISSENWMLGMSISSGSWLFDVELYEKQREGIVEYALRRPGFNRDGVITEPIFGFFQGKGRTRGMDLLLQKNGRWYNGWIAYTLSKSTHQLQGVNFNRPFLAPDDSRHQLRWVNQFTIHKDWLLSLNTIFASGLPYLDYSQIDNIPDDRRQVPYDLLIERYKNYYRMDLSVNYSTQLWGLDTQLGFSIFNLWNRENVRYQQFVFSVEENEENRVLGTELELLPRIWNLSVAVQF
jgi:ferric enterobactin receptor